MAGDTQQSEDDFRGLNFARIEKDGLGELHSSPGPGWRSFLVFDRKKKRLGRLNVIDFDEAKARREGELKFALKLRHDVFDPVLDHGQDEDSLYFVSDMALESEPLTSYLDRKAPLHPMHGFELIQGYLNALKSSRKFEKAPKGLEFFRPERLRVAVGKSGKTGLVFCGFGGAESAEPKLALALRVSALASRMGLGFSESDLPKKGGIAGFVKWMESFRKDLEATDLPLPRPKSEIRKWLAETPERRDLICKSAPEGMAELVPDLKELVIDAPAPEAKSKPKKKAKAKISEAKAEIPPAEIVEEEPEIEELIKLPTAKLKSVSGMEKIVISDDVDPDLPSMGTMFQRGALLQKVKSGGSDSGDEVVDLLPDYEASRSKRKSPMTLAIVSCAVIAVIIWLVSLNIDVVANSIYKLMGKERKPRSGFEQLIYDEEEDTVSPEENQDAPDPEN